MAGYAYASGLVDVVRNIEIRYESDAEGEYDEEGEEEGGGGQEEE
jgi:hypothetical protein